MKKTRFAILAATAFILSLAGGMALGYINTPTEGETPAENITPVVIEEETLRYAPKTVTHYEVTISGEYIVLREVFYDNTKNEIDRAEINTSVLPKDDVIVLREGVAFTHKDEALMLIENFVS